jgi:hypothetical protein
LDGALFTFDQACGLQPEDGYEEKAGPMNPLRWMFQFVFGCRHRHLSRVFTIKGRTYKVCFDCGEEFDLPDAHAASAA